ncbi:MAG: bacteriohopanetetrol glucosamine biosynthesis glycosyltransferase HpnI [Geminicoccaceae bacterium]
MSVAAAIAAGLAVAGIAQCLLGWMLVRRFARGDAGSASVQPPLTVLKPLHGDEPLLAEGLATFCRQDYPAYQLVFGVSSAADPALAVVRWLQAKFAACDIAVVVDATEHGPNGKVGNLINMLPAAKHGVLVIADSDLHVAPDYLARLAAALEKPGVGLVTTLYAGWPAEDRWPARLGATQITHGFLPGALLARWMGRQDCLGATMMLRRETLARIGGLAALAPHLSDDHVLGRRVQQIGLRVALARTVPLTIVPETTLAALLSHELRWARTIRALVPFAFAGSCLQYPIFFAAMALALSQGAAWAGALFAAAWAVRGVAATAIDHSLRARTGGVAFAAPVWLLPLRDLISVAVMLASYCGSRVTWRGQTLHADDGGRQRGWSPRQGGAGLAQGAGQREC